MIEDGAWPANLVYVYEHLTEFSIKRDHWKNFLFVPGRRNG